MMILVYLILVLLAISVTYVLLHSFRLGLTAYYDEDGLTARVWILPPLLRVEVQIDESTPYLLIFLFGLRILKKEITRKRKPGGAKNGMRLVRSASVKDIDINAWFGLQDPFTTGVAFAAAGAVARFLPIKRLDIAPDFLSASPHLSVDGHATVRFGQTILSYIRNR